jgi:hypothetical protein
MIMARELDFGKVHELVARLLKSVEESGRSGKRVDLVERELLQKLLEVGLEILAEYIASAGDGDEGETLERGERKLVRLKAKKQRAYSSIFGKITFRRYVYGSRDKQKVEWVPLDAKLGMPAAEQSYVLEDLLQKLVAQLPYGEAVERLEDFLGVNIGQRTAEAMASRLSDYSVSFRRSQSPPKAEAEGEIMVMTLDGKGVPVRRPLEHRLQEECGIARPVWKSRVKYEKSSKRRQRGEPKSRKQMAYVGIVYSIDPFVRTAAEIVQEVQRKKCRDDRPPPRNKRAWAEMTQIREGEVSDGQPRLFIELACEVRLRTRRQSKPLVCVMDGQRSFRKLFQHFAQVTPILDIYHGIERLWNAAHCFHADCSLGAEQFVDRYLQMLLEGKVGSVIGAFKRFVQKLRKGKRKNLEKVITYLENNRDYMRYDKYLESGYPIGSGVVEGACRHVVKDRMEQSGMRWEAEGAQAVLNLRAIHINGDWNDFIQHRIQTEQARLYRLAA